MFEYATADGLVSLMTAKYFAKDCKYNPFNAEKKAVSRKDIQVQSTGCQKRANAVGTKPKAKLLPSKEMDT